MRQRRVVDLAKRFQRFTKMAQPRGIHDSPSDQRKYRQSDERMHMKRVVVTGLGFITSIGNNKAEVLESLRTRRSGIEVHPELDRPEIPVKLAGTVKGFDFPGENPENWQLPADWSIPRGRLRSMPPH